MWSKKKRIYKVGLVGCVKKKRPERSKAKDLYNSELFMKARRYAETHYDEWFILSAKYHLVDPEAFIEPYDETLNEKTASERKEWSRKVFVQIRETLAHASLYELFFHTGARYKEFLIRLLTKAGYSCKVPIEGLKIGEQLFWYKRHETINSNRKYVANIDFPTYEEERGHKIHLNPYYPGLIPRNKILRHYDPEDPKAARDGGPYYLTREEAMECLRSSRRLEWLGRTAYSFRPCLICDRLSGWDI